MITVIEDELLKIIHPIIQRSELPTEPYDCRLNIDIIASREKINLINNLKSFFKSNLNNPSLLVIFSKHISIIFSKILFHCLNDADQNVRIAADECVNLIVRLTVFSFHSYIVYSLFVEIKAHSSVRALNSALHKFSGLSSLIKPSRRVSYVNHVLPVLRQIIRLSNESVSAVLVDSLPRIATVLFPFASDDDIERSVLVPLVKSIVKPSVAISNQRYLSQLIAHCVSNMRSRGKFVSKILRHFLSFDSFNSFSRQKRSIDIDWEIEIRAALFSFKSLLVSSINDDNDWIFVLIRLIDLIDRGDSSGSIKNLCLDCLSHFLSSIDNDDEISNRISIVGKIFTYRSMLDEIKHDSIFDLNDDDDNDDDDSSMTPAIIIGDNRPQKQSNGEDLIDNIELANIDLLSSIDDNREMIDLFDDLIENQSTSEAGSIDPIGTVSVDEETTIDEEREMIDNLIDQSEQPEIEGDDKEREESFLSQTGMSAIDYLINRLIDEFLPESNGGGGGNVSSLSRSAFSKRRKNNHNRSAIKVNSKVLAINCLREICRLNYRLALKERPPMSYDDDDGNCSPPVVECVLHYCSDEDAQLSGAAIQLLAQVLRSHFNESKYHSNTKQSSESIKIDCRKMIEIIQSQITNPTSGQHLKSVLSSLKLFLFDLASTEYGEMTVDLCESVLRYTDHSYKLVRKEILLISQVIDFRSLSLIMIDKNGPVIIKKTSLADKYITAVLELLGDVEQDIREDACDSLQFLISNGAFDKENLFSHCSCALHSDLSFSSLTDRSRLIPFLHRNINVSLSDIRKKQQSTCSQHDTQSTVHQVVHLIIERLLSNPVISTKEMKLALNKISGCIHALLVLHEKYPITTHSKVWIGQNIFDNGSVTETRTLMGYCLSLLSTSVIISDICLHTNILILLSKLIFHGGIKHLMLNNLITERSNPEIGINTQLNNNLYFVLSIKQVMIHLCRCMNIYWHIFQFITPTIPPHKTVLPNLSSQTHVSPGKKKVDPGPTKSNSDSQSSADSRPPRAKSSVGYFVTESNYMMMHKHFSVAYNSFLISFDSSPHTDRLLNLLSECMNSLGSVFEFLTFSEVSMHIEELLSYCSIFYNFLPSPTVNLIIKLLGSLFGTNLTAQWDSFLAQLFQQLFCATSPENEPDLIINMVNSWKSDCSRDGSNLQNQLKRISTSAEGSDTSQIYKRKTALSDIFIWVKASGKRREPGILRQIALTSSAHRPSLGHYIGLFEKHVFQCMRQYVVSSTELQTSIISLLCQLIYLRVNYCQLDSEQKFLIIVQHQLESFTSYNMECDKDASLIIEITEFLILISYEKAAGNKKDQPILNITQVIRCIESLLVNGINVKSVIISCMWKIVCDLFVHRSVWLNNPGNFNLLPNSNTSKEIEAQREAIVDFLLRKLIKYPETLEILSLILEHSAREQEIKWQTLSKNIWGRLATALFEDSIEFSTTVHIDHLYRLLRLLSLPTIKQSFITKNIVDLTVKFDSTFPINQDVYSSNIMENYRFRLVQAVRSVLCLQMIVVHKIDVTDESLSSKLIIDCENETQIQKEFYRQIINIFQYILEMYNFTMSNQYLRNSINAEYLEMTRKLIRTLLLIFIDMKLTDKNNVEEKDCFDIISKLDSEFIVLSNSDIDLLLLWNELKLTCDINSNIEMIISGDQSQLIIRQMSRNHVFQCCRHLAKLRGPNLNNLIANLITKYYSVLIDNVNQKSVAEVLDFVNKDEKLSSHLLVTFIDWSKQILSSTSTVIKWLNMIEHIHLSASSTMISLLVKYVVSQAQDFSVIVLMKVEKIICCRLKKMIEDNFDICGDYLITEAIKSIEKSIENQIVPMKMLKKTIQQINDMIKRPVIPEKLESPLLDPLFLEKINSDELNEKNFWKICVEISLRNHDQDIRLGPRLLQGGSSSDLEQFFGVKCNSEEPLFQLESATDEVIKNLPPRFVQQCLRLGFLRSGGGSVQEGVKVDLIFRLGTKLVFEELGYILKETKICLQNQDFNRLSQSVLMGLVAALNDYLSLSCQLSVPMPVSNDASDNLVSLIEFLCIFFTKSKSLHSRLLIEELLTLITTCYGKSSLLTDEGIKNIGNGLSLNRLSVIVDFLYLLVDQFSSNKLHGSMNYSLTRNDEIKDAIRTVLKLDKILKYYYAGQMEDSNSELQRKLRLAVVSVARLPCVIAFTRNPKNIKDLDLCELENIFNDLSKKNVIELDCLSKMNRDDLTASQTILNSLGWTSRFMFEESWLLFLNLLHDKGPSGALSGKNITKSNLTSEELVELGHCDSLGLLGLTDMILQTTARPNPGNPAVAQLEHKTRDKTPNLIHTKIGRKLCAIHAQLEEEIFHCHRGFKMLSAGWTITSWNLEREDSVLKYRHDQISITVLAKRISIGSRSPQISGSNSNNLDVLSCLQSLPIICQQWLETPHDSKTKSIALWPRVCALRSAVMLMDLFSSREQVLWLLESLLELYKSLIIEDDWITTSWLCIGLSKCVAVLETSSNAVLPPNTAAGKPPNPISTNSVYGLPQSLKLIESCLNSDITILQQSAFHSSMCLLQMTVYGKNTWDLPAGSLVELKNMHDTVMRFLDNQLMMIDMNTSSIERRISFSDSLNINNSMMNSNSLTQVMSSGAASLANTVSGFTSINNVNTQLGLMNTGSSNSLVYSSSNSLPRLLKSNHILLRTERHNYLVMATACFYCERYPDALSESDILNNFVSLANNIMQQEKKRDFSPQILLTLCRCLERISLTQRISTIVTDQIIRLCGNYLKTCKSTAHSLPVLGLFLTSCYLSLANSNAISTTPTVFESVFHNGPTNFIGENQLVMLERINLFWKRLTDPEMIDAVESRILSRLVSSIMTEFMSGEDLLNKTIHQLLRCWPRSQCVAKILFDVITKCLNQSEGEKLIRKWTLLVLQSLTSCRPDNLAIWATTVVLIAAASSSRSCLRALFSQCLDWLTHYERGEYSMSEIETGLCLAALAFIQDLSRDPVTENENKTTFMKAMLPGSNIPAFQKFFSMAREKHLL